MLIIPLVFVRLPWARDLKNSHVVASNRTGYVITSRRWHRRTPSVSQSPGSARPILGSNYHETGFASTPRCRAPRVLLGLRAAKRAQLSDLQQHPGRYEDRTVTVTGIVTDSWGIPLVPFKFYRVDDGTGADRRAVQTAHDRRERVSASA